MPALPWSRSSSSSNLSSSPPLATNEPRTFGTSRQLFALSCAVLGVGSTLGGAFVYRRFFRRLRSSGWVTPDVLKQRRWVRGVVTSVGDGDNFRLYHTPAFGWRWPLKFRRVPSKAKDLKDETIHIRIAGVDAPERSHFGREAQPYSDESLAWLKNAIEGKTLYCQLCYRDQYSRIISVVTYPPRFLPGTIWWGESLSLQMLRVGCATTYTLAGAEYSPWGMEEHLRVEGEARKKKRGMWAFGPVESPAEYKKRHAATKTPPPESSSSSVVEPRRARSSKQRPLTPQEQGSAGARGGWLARLFRRGGPWSGSK